VKAGKVRSIGISNFDTLGLTQQAIDFAEIKPQTVQVEAHPYYPQTELKKLLTPYGIGLMAWYPLGHGDKSLIEEPVFTELGKKYGKTPAQIVLRWHIQSGNVVIPGSRNPAHIRDNFDIFDFALTADEMAKIATLDKNKRYYNGTPERIAGYKAWAPDFDAQE
jgi:diketogulonate reductase-like aldo/keto reductase